jgi:hypothetical protein
MDVAQAPEIPITPVVDCADLVADVGTGSARRKLTRRGRVLLILLSLVVVLAVATVTINLTRHGGGPGRSEQPASGEVSTTPNSAVPAALSSSVRSLTSRRGR